LELSSNEKQIPQVVVGFALSVIAAKKVRNEPFSAGRTLAKGQPRCNQFGDGFRRRFCRAPNQNEACE